MSPKRPYLLRALIEWIVDNRFTPYVLVEVTEGVQVPQAYVSDGRIVLNVSPVAVRDLSISNDHLMFDGRFGGASFPVTVPMRSVMAVYAKESGEGMLFEPEYPPAAAEVAGSSHPVDPLPGKDAGTPGAPPPRVPGGGPRRRGHLTPVK